MQEQMEVLMKRMMNEIEVLLLIVMNLDVITTA